MRTSLKACAILTAYVLVVPACGVDTQPTSAVAFRIDLPSIRNENEIKTDRIQSNSRIGFSQTLLDFNDANDEELKTGTGPVAFIVNGFGGCDPCVLDELTKDLRFNGATVYVADWSDIERARQVEEPQVFDESFVREMTTKLDYVVNPQRPVILIGHSFGGDSALKIAQRTKRRIQVLGILDAVEGFGIRTRRSVLGNVDYFYNRWTQHPTVVPFDAWTNSSGEVSSAAVVSDQKEQSIARNRDGSEIRDACDFYEFTCVGYSPWPGATNGTKARRITHGGSDAIYKDLFIQHELLQISIPGAKVRSDPFFGSRGTTFADVSGDGWHDAIAINADMVAIRKSYGTGFSETENWTDHVYLGSRGNFFQDVTGDGAADAIVVNEDAVVVRRSDYHVIDSFPGDQTRGIRISTRFLQNEIWAGVYHGSRGNHFADVTGDGKADAIVVNEDTITVRRSNGTSFEPNEDWTRGVYVGSRGVFFADVTGDKAADAIVVNEDAVVVRRSNHVPANTYIPNPVANAFLPNESWAGVYHGSRGNHFADVTGDGKADAIVVNEDTITVRRSNGTSFEPNEDWTHGPYLGSKGNLFADVNGDGKADAIVINEDRITVRKSNGIEFAMP